MSKKNFIALADAIKSSRERWLGYIRGENGKSGGDATACVEAGKRHRLTTTSAKQKIVA